jgi:hypothetical protein
MPDHVIVGQTPPSLAHLCGLAERGGIQVAQDLERDLGRESGEEVDPDEFSNRSGEEGQLREAALREDATEHQLSVFGGSGREE